MLAFDKYKLMNERTKAALWFTICSFLQRGISFITVPIFTRILTTEQYGTYTMYLSWLQIFTVISSLYLYYGVTDNAMSKFYNDRSRFISSMQGLTVTITSCVLIITIIGGKLLRTLLGFSSIMVILMFMELYVTPAFYFWSAKQRFEYRYKSIVAVTLSKSILNPIIGLIAVYIAYDKALARITSTALVEFVFCGTILIRQFVRGKTFYDKKYWKYALVLAVPMLPHYLSGMILNHGDRIMISKFFTNSEVALYGVAYNIGMLAQIFVTAINNAVTPWVYGKLKESNINAIRHKSKGLMIFIFCVVIALMLVSPELVLIFGSSKYANAVYVIPPVAGSVFFVFLYGYLSFPEFYYEKTSFLMIASAIAAGLNILLNYIFIPVFGYVAAAYTTLACYAVYSIGHYIVGKRILFINTGDKSIVNNSFALTFSVLVIILSSFAYIVFPYFVLRYSIIGYGMIVAFIKRKTIVCMLIREKK